MTETTRKGYTAEELHAFVDGYDVDALRSACHRAVTELSRQESQIAAQARVIDKMKAVIRDYKEGTRPRRMSKAEMAEVRAIHGTLDVVTSELDRLLAEEGLS